MGAGGFVLYSEMLPLSLFFLYIKYIFIYIKHKWDTGKQKQKQEDWKVPCISDASWMLSFQTEFLLFLNISYALCI